jgi:hypothetical protein
VKLLLFLAASALAFGADSAQRVIDDYLKAQGGAKALTQMRAETISGNLTDESGKTGSYSLIIKAPNQFYSEILIEPNRTVEAYNGMSAWGQRSGEGAITLTGTAAKEAEGAGIYWNGRLADLKKDKMTVQLVGTEKVHERDAYHIQVRRALAVMRDLFFDTQTHLIVREATPTQQFDYDNYRPVMGIQTPYRILLHRDGHDYKVSVTRAEYNTTVDDSTFGFPRTTDAALPDIKALLLEVTKNQKAIEAMQKQYTCHVASEQEEADSKGQLKGTKLKEFEVFNLAGEEARHLVAKDGNPLTGDEKRKEDERFNKEFEKLTKQEADLARDPKKQEKEEAKDESDLSDFLRAILFSNPRRERFRGQDVIAVDFGPNLAYKPKKTMENLAQKLVGVMWIDEQAHDVARVEGHFNASMKIAGGVVASLDKGSSFVFEQAKINGEVWMPVYDEIHVNGHFLFLKAKANQIERYSDCKKFHAESKFILGQN